MNPVSYHTVQVDDVTVFYREAGAHNTHALVLLHGFPSSSHMFRNVLPTLAEHFHVVAPDYPGYGYSDRPDVEHFTYTFDHLEEVIEHVLDTLTLHRVSLYVQDYGAPVGFRLAVKHPERIEAIISQNGNAYLEGLTSFWDAAWPFWSQRTSETEQPIRALFTSEATRWQYTQGAARARPHQSRCLDVGSVGTGSSRQCGHSAGPLRGLSHESRAVSSMARLLPPLSTTSSCRVGQA